MKERLAEFNVLDEDTDNLIQYIPSLVEIELNNIAEVIHEGLMSLGLASGLMVMKSMIDKEVEELVGVKNAKLSDRKAYRYGSTSGTVTFGSRRIKVTRPRVRSTDNKEKKLKTWDFFSSRDPLKKSILERLIAGVSTRKMSKASEGPSTSVEYKSLSKSKSSVSREFKDLTESAIKDVMEQDLSDLNIKVLMIDGIEVAKSCVVAALGVKYNGEKVPVGLIFGDTENKTVVSDLLSNLVQRGLDSSNGLL